MTEKPLIDACAPILLISDIHKSADWYRDTLGFTYDQMWGDPPGFVILNQDNMSLMLKTATREFIRPNRLANGFTWDAYYWITSMDRFRAGLKARGVEHPEPEVTEYGCKELTFTDPDGYWICFGECS